MMYICFFHMQVQSSKSVALNVYEAFIVVALKLLVFIRALPQWDRNVGLPKKVKRTYSIVFLSKHFAR